MEKLKTNILPKAKELQQSMMISDIDEFGTELIKLAEQHHADLIINFGNKLKNSVMHFDIENMDILLRSIPSIIYNLNQIP